MKNQISSKKQNVTVKELSQLFNETPKDLVKNIKYKNEQNQYNINSYSIKSPVIWYNSNFISGLSVKLN